MAKDLVIYFLINCQLICYYSVLWIVWHITVTAVFHLIELIIGSVSQLSAPEPSAPTLWNNRTTNLLWLSFCFSHSLHNIWVERKWYLISINVFLSLNDIPFDWSTDTEKSFAKKANLMYSYVNVLSDKRLNWVFW